MATLEKPAPLPHVLRPLSPPPVPLAFVPLPTLQSATLVQDDSVDLIALGEEPLFSGSRRNDAENRVENGAADACATPSPQATPLLAPGVVRSLGAAKNAFLLTLQRILEPPLFQDVASPSNTNDPYYEIPHSAPNYPSSALQLSDTPHDFVLSNLLKSLRLKGGDPVTAPLSPDLRVLSSAPISTQEGLMDELQAHVEVAASELSPLDAELARSLGALLSCLERLLSISDVAPGSTEAPISPSRPESGIEHSNVYAQLEREARILGSNRDQWSATELGSVVGAAREVERAEREVLWGRVDELLEKVGGLCRARGSGSETEERSRTLGRPPSIGSLASFELPKYSNDNHRLPPAYASSLESDLEETPDEKAHPHSVDNVVASTSSAHPRFPDHDEKMRLELEIVSTAIERLYLVCPQLANQRVDVNRTLSREKQLATLGNAIERLSRGRLDDQRVSIAPVSLEERATRLQRDHDAALDDLIDKINRAASRTLVSQRVDLSAKRHPALTRRSNELNATLNRYDDAEEIVRNNGKGRLISQDAAIKPPQIPITLGEFFGDSSSSRVAPFPILRKTQSFVDPINGERRPSRRGSLILNVFKKIPNSTPMSRRSSQGSKSDLGIPASNVEFVVEESRNIGSVVVDFWQPSGTPNQTPWEVLSVLPSSIIVARAGSGIPISIPLPCQVLPQQVAVSTHDTFFEVKLSTADLTITRPRPDLEVHAPLSTAQLRESLPVNFVCATCRTEIVESSTITQYNALPSEHWAELLDAWMCHQDQALSDDLVAKGKGIKPRANEGLVGSTYIVFRREVTGNWFCPEDIEPTRSEADDLLHAAHCSSCDALIGQHVVSLAPNPPSTYLRLLKYATCPTTPSPSPHPQGRPRDPLPRYSLASHLTAEMLEIGQAHACHRFVIEDSGEEKARVLLWLFNPAVRICFSTYSQAGRFLDQQSPRPEGAGVFESDSTTCRTINAVKVFYSIVSNESSPECQEFINSEDLTTERLGYPLEVIERLTELLQASSSVFPLAKRTWGAQFRAGFLQRI